MGNTVPGTEVHLVGGLTTECGVGEARVMLVHIERDQLLESADRVERGVGTVPEGPRTVPRAPDILYA